MRIAPNALNAIVAHAREAAPAECCGLLVGRDAAITEAVRARNLAEDASRFLIDPRDHIDARRDARRRGVDVLGFYHSHPHSGARPSPTDLAEASYPDHLYLIVSLRDERADVKLYRLEAGAFCEVLIEGSDLDFCAKGVSGCFAQKSRSDP